MENLKDKKTDDILEKLVHINRITKIYFDRGSYKYHGRIKVFAETLRENGMEF